MRGFVAEVKEAVSCRHLRFEGVFTHFAASDRVDKSSAKRQLDLFLAVLDRLEAERIVFAVRHAANSAAVLELPEAHLDMVRPGIILYGLSPSTEVAAADHGLRPAMQIKARIAQLKKVPAGFTVSYGHTHVTPEPTCLATIPVGYGDGYSRKLSSTGAMLVRGCRAPIVGRVCMDQTIIDVGRIPDVCVDDEVVIMGRQGNETMSADEIAGLIGTINYEVVTSLLARVARVIT